MQGLCGVAGEVDADILRLKGAFDLGTQSDGSLGPLSGEDATALAGDGQPFVLENAQRLLDGHASHAIALRQIWRPAKVKAGVVEAVHFHDLRHTGNHLAAASGASPRELMGRMGHSSMRAALIYQHRTADPDRLIADALDSLIDASQRARSGGPNGPDGEGTRSRLGT